MEKEYDLKDIDLVAVDIIKNLNSKIIIFDGEMGAGKTTLIKAISKQLGVETGISSPTFSLVNEYQTNQNKIIYHFDFYRLNSENEALDFGVEEYFYSDAICFLEWSSKIPNLIPEKNQTIKIEIVSENKRKLTLI